MSAGQVVGLTDDELYRIPEIAKQIKDGEKQVKEFCGYTRQIMRGKSILL